MAGGRKSTGVWGACALVSSLVGCAELTGIDSYAVGEGCPSGQVRALEGSCVSVSACAPGELAVRDGSCRRIGVSECGAGFAPTTNGSCEPVLPAEPCPTATLTFPGETGCSPGPPCPSDWPSFETVGVERYVRAGSDAQAADGSQDHPFATIGDALGDLDSVGAPEATIAVGAGSYPETLVIDRRVQLVGLCPQQTVVTGAMAEEPIITFGAGASRSILSNITLRGGSGGIAVRGGILVKRATDVRISRTGIIDVGGAGVEFEEPDVDGPAGEIDFVLVERATGGGIVTHGADVNVKHSAVLDTLAAVGGRPGPGIVAKASGFLAGEPAGATDASGSRRSTLHVEKCLVSGSHGAGILVEGSNASIVSTLVRDTHPDRDGQGRGIVVSWRPLGGIPSAVTLEGSVVEESHDIGVYVWNSRATLRNSVVRKVGLDRVEDEPASAPCLGNGVRVRFDRADVPNEDAPVAIESSVIEAVRESGVHAEGAVAVLSSSIVRDVRRDCRDRFGDGVAAYGSSISEAALRVAGSSIEKVDRAAVAAFSIALSSVITLDGATLDCGAAHVVASGGDVEGAAVCTCGGGFGPCRKGSAPVEPALRGGAGCNPSDDTVCIQRCFASGGPMSTAADVTFRVGGRDDLAPAMTDAFGCWELEGLPANTRLRTVITHPENVPGSGLIETGAADLPVRERVRLPVGPAREIDYTRVSHAVGLYVCSPPSDLDPSQELLEVQEWCPSGVPGVTASLSPPVVAPLYTNASGAFGPAAAEGPLIAFPFVPAGDYVLSVHAPAGARGFRCSMDPLGINGGWLQGWPKGADSTELELRVEAGFGLFGARVYCTVER